MLVDHAEGQAQYGVFQSWAPISTAFFDGAEAFVFLSGIVFALVYTRRLEQGGLGLALKKGIRRALTIYLTFVATTWVALAIGTCLREITPAIANLLRLDEGIGECAVWALALYYQPPFLSILCFYVTVLPLMPVLFWLYLRSKRAAAAVSLVLYVATQVVPELRLPTFPAGREWFFNPMAWQFLFFLGLAAGAWKTSPHPNPLQWGEGAEDPHPGPLPRGEGAEDGTAARAFLATLAAAVLVFGVIVRCGWLDRIPGMESVEPQVSAVAREWSGKTRLEPLRIIHFLSFAYLLSIVLPARDARFWRTRIAEPLVKCGRNSLEVYAFGVVLTFLTIPAFLYLGQSTWIVLLVDFDCVALSIAFAYALDRRKNRSAVPSMHGSAASPVRPRTNV